MAETALQFCITGVLLIGTVAFLLLCLQTIGSFLRDLLSPTTVRTVLRSVKRFRLRTLLGLVAVAQIFVAIVVWETNQSLAQQAKSTCSTERPTASSIRRSFGVVRAREKATVDLAPS